jgi:hypothetical protein
VLLYQKPSSLLKISAVALSEPLQADIRLAHYRKISVGHFLSVLKKAYGNPAGAEASGGDGADERGSPAAAAIN